MGRARRALGLRGRIAGAVFLSAVVTLAVAAVALLGPLEHSLRNAEIKSLHKSLGKHPARTFQRLPLCTIVTDLHNEQRRLGAAESHLAGQIGGQAVVLGTFTPSGTYFKALPRKGDNDELVNVGRDSYPDAVQAYRTGAPVSSATAVAVRKAIPFSKKCPIGSQGVKIKTTYVLAVRKSIAEIPAVVHVVRRAFFDAALAALALTLLLGIPLSGRLVRRLRRLREVAIDAARDAPMIVPVDNAADEVGDLARALHSMQQQLRIQEEARRSFVATASHELRTPLASLDGMLELLGDDLQDVSPDIQDARALLDRARAQSRRLGRLAADLLDLSRIDAQIQLRSEPVELGELSRAVLAEFELGSAERGIQTDLRADGEHAVWALGDPGSIARILRILLDNALRVSPPDTRVAVLLTESQGGARITVSDQGPGVDPEERDAIFDRFSRGKDTAGQAGFGLGLAIGRELAQRMGGDLLLEDSSETPPAGARFTLCLPAALAPEGDPVAVA
jgi:signal transduction histidine kinase